MTAGELERRGVGRGWREENAAALRQEAEALGSRGRSTPRGGVCCELQRGLASAEAPTCEGTRGLGSAVRPGPGCTGCRGPGRCGTPGAKG